MPNAASIVLEPLTAAESAQLVDALLAGGLPAELGERVVLLADGNPLFTEELVRMFVDRGVLRFVDGRWELARPVDEVEIPGSIHAVLAARLDGLPAAEKRAAQDAAVVGRVFWDALIAHLSHQGAAATGELLRRLRVKELVIPRQPSSLAGAAEFGFRHVLIRDVAYDSLPKRDRAAKHLDVARWAEEALADRQDEMVELIAAHYLAALRYEEEFAEAGSERLADLRRRTMDCARRAGRRADAVFNKQTAARWFRVAADQARTLRLPVRDRVAMVLEYAVAAWGTEPNETARAILEEAFELFVAIPDRTPDDEELGARLRAELVFYLVTAHEIEAARRVCRDGIDAMASGPPTRGRALLRERLGWTFWRGGPLEEAPPILRLAIEEARVSGAADIERLALHDLAIASGMLGDLAGSEELVLESMELARAAGDRFLLTRCFINVPAIMTGNGQLLARVFPIVEEGLDRARRTLDHAAAAWIAQNAAEDLGFAGRVREAAGYAEEAIAHARAIGDPARLAAGLSQRARIRLLAGDRAGAGADVDLARRTFTEDEPQSAISEVEIDALFLWPDEPARAARLLADALGSPAIAQASIIDTAPGAIRMALRTDDQDLVARDVRAFLAVAARATGPVRALQRRWFEGVLAADPRGIADIRGVAAEFEALDYPLPAADAYADAALLASRIGDDPGPDRRHAADLYERCGAIPRLEVLVPELSNAIIGATGTES
jgi:tetratricopeptide (TPR) repeat protein